MKKSTVAKKVKFLKREIDRVKRKLIANASDRTVKEESVVEKSLLLNSAVGALVTALRKEQPFEEALKAVKKLLPRSVRIATNEGKLFVYHDCPWEDVPLQLRFAADYAEQQLKKGLGLRTKVIGGRATKHKVKSSEGTLPKEEKAA